MPHETDITSDSWYLCYTLSKLKFHIGMAPAGSRLTTGQDLCELFDSESLLAARVDELNGEGWYEDNRPVETDQTPPSNIT